MKRLLTLCAIIALQGNAHASLWQTHADPASHIQFQQKVDEFTGLPQKCRIVIGDYYSPNMPALIVYGTPNRGIDNLYMVGMLNQREGVGFAYRLKEKGKVYKFGRQKTQGRPYAQRMNSDILDNLTKDSVGADMKVFPKYGDEKFFSYDYTLEQTQSAVQKFTDCVSGGEIN